MRFLLVGLLTLAGCAHAADPFFEKIDLFTAGEGGHFLFHIPGIIVTAKGTALAWCEGRKRGGDWGDIEIVMRRSTDDGKNWSAPKVICDVPGPKKKNPAALQIPDTDPSSVTYSNPVMIAGRDGTVHMLFCLEHMKCYYQRSTDDGVTWSTPTEITGTFDQYRPSYQWRVFSTGPDHGIELKNGRLMVPVWLSLGTEANPDRPSAVSTIYSDDHGKTWHAGEVAARSTKEWLNPNETTAVELADGRVMLNMRNESKEHRRLVTTSRDGATGWSTPKFDQALQEPICMGSLVRYSLEWNGGKNRILFSNPDNLLRADGKVGPNDVRDRKNLSVKLSYDEGKTWAVNKVVDPGYSGYSDIAVTKDGTILCFYGRGDVKDFGGYAFKYLTLARFNLEWLTGGKDQP